MTLTQLEYLVAIDVHKSFTAAADACGVTQPSLSMQIQKLESELGIELLDRNSKPVRPTDIGKLVVQQAHVVLREYRRIQEIIEEAHNEYVGEIRLSIIPTVSPYLLPLILTPFARRFPGILLHITDRTTPQILQALVDNELDAGIIASPVIDRNLISRDIYDEPFVAYVNSQHRLAKKTQISTTDLSLDDMWVLSEGHCFREQVLAFCATNDRACGQARRVRFESGNLDTLIKMVEFQDGMTLLPSMATRYLSQDQVERYVKKLVDAPVRTVRLVRHRSYLKQHLVEALYQTIFEQVSAHSGGL